VFLEQVQPAHDRVECRVLLLIYPVFVVQLSRAVDRQSDEEAVLCEELAPLIIKQRAVGLKGVGDRLALRVLLLKFDDLAEERYAQQRRLAALPGEADLGDRLILDVLADVFFQHFVTHPPLVLALVQLLLFQIEAVFAVEVADRPDRLGQQVKGPVRLGVFWYLHRR
jgi:hypothetical protein